MHQQKEQSKSVKVNYATRKSAQNRYSLKQELGKIVSELNAFLIFLIYAPHIIKDSGSLSPKLSLSVFYLCACYWTSYWNKQFNQSAILDLEQIKAFLKKYLSSLSRVRFDRISEHLTCRDAVQFFF